MPHLPHRGEQARAPRRICRPQAANRLRHFVPHFLPHGQKTGPQYPNRRKILHPLPAAFLPYRQKTGASVADFRVRRREIILIVFSDDTVVALRLARPFGRANRAASSKPARFIRHWRRFAAFHVRQKKHFSARKCGICPPRRANYARSGLHPPQKRKAVLSDSLSFLKQNYS